MSYWFKTHSAYYRYSKLTKLSCQDNTLDEKLTYSQLQVSNLYHFLVLKNVFLVLFVYTGYFRVMWLLKYSLCQFPLQHDVSFCIILLPSMLFHYLTKYWSFNFGTNISPGRLDVLEMYGIFNISPNGSHIYELVHLIYQYVLITRLYSQRWFKLWMTFYSRVLVFIHAEQFNWGPCNQLKNT